MSLKSARIQAFLDRVGHRVRQLRKGQRWTIQRLADEAALSRRMLTQIELGQANPSLATIDRIAHALEVSFADLALGDTAPAGPSAFTPAAVEGSLDGSADFTSAHALAWEGSHGSTAYILGASTVAGTELWRWRLGPSVHYQAEADRAGAEEILHVLSGVLGIEHSGETVELSAGMSTRIATDRAYSYTARRETPVDFIRVSIGA